MTYYKIKESSSGKIKPSLWVTSAAASTVVETIKKKTETYKKE